MKSVYCGARFLIVVSALLAKAAWSFGFTPQSSCRRQKNAASVFRRHAAPPQMGILNRFRRKKDVKQASTIKIGDKIPEIDVEKVSLVNGTAQGEAMTIHEAMGSSTALLVGMPGAFTPTCTAKHLPGYVKNAPKLAKLGIDKIAVVTTNDKFVNEAWGESYGLMDAKKDSGIDLLCDGDGELVKAMGLSDDMGFGVGIRSARFAMTLENGVVTNLLTDPGMDSCDSTSAESVIRLLSPEGDVDDADFDPAALAAVGLGVALLLFVSTATGGGSNPSGAGSGTFDLLNQFQ